MLNNSQIFGDDNSIVIHGKNSYINFVDDTTEATLDADTLILLTAFINTCIDSGIIDEKELAKNFFYCKVKWKFYNY